MKGKSVKVSWGKFLKTSEERYPVILTTSQLLTTGVDAPTCQNVVLVRTVGSMSEFKQTVGRGTRVREENGKPFFNILDYTGSATQMFADPEFDWRAALVSEEEIDEDGETIEGSEHVEEEQDDPSNEEETSDPNFDDENPEPESSMCTGDRGELILKSQWTRLRRLETSDCSDHSIRG
ncbi:MAG: hypothetical protein R3C12_24020 [Planctomycetaceae bacterium]